jgi:hypothetical protein
VYPRLESPQNRALLGPTERTEWSSGKSASLFRGLFCLGPARSLCGGDLSAALRRDLASSRGDGGTLLLALCEGRSPQAGSSATIRKIQIELNATDLLEPTSRFHLLAILDRCTWPAEVSCGRSVLNCGRGCRDCVMALRLRAVRFAVLRIKRDRASIGAWFDALDVRAPKIANAIAA